MTHLFLFLLNLLSICEMTFFQPIFKLNCVVCMLCAIQFVYTNIQAKIMLTQKLLLFKVRFQLSCTTLYTFAAILNSDQGFYYCAARVPLGYLTLHNSMYKCNYSLHKKVFNPTYC